jgi:hypothetical protein
MLFVKNSVSARGPGRKPVASLYTQERLSFSPLSLSAGDGTEASHSQAKSRENERVGPATEFLPPRRIIVSGISFLL